MFIQELCNNSVHPAPFYPIVASYAVSLIEVISTAIKNQQTDRVYIKLSDRVITHIRH